MPQAIDAICVGIADVDASGGQFGQLYRLEGDLAGLPQTLRIEGGGASAAWAWVRGDRGGVPVVRAGSLVDFAANISLDLDRCEVGAAGAPRTIGEPVGPADARLVVSHGANGQLVVALGVALGGGPGATAAVIDAQGETLVTTVGPELSAGALTAVIAADLDGDCDDDLVLAASGGPPVFWIRDATGFTLGSTLGTDPVAALTFGDVDRDGDTDLITGGGGTLSLWRNDGSGAYARDGAALAGEGRVTAISALALGDLDGDGTPDLVVGQAGGPLAAWLGERDGTGSFLPADAVVPPVPLDVLRLALVDVDGDFDPDLVVAVRSAPLRLYIDREGSLEDQTFVRFPAPIPRANAIAIGGWDAGCEPDAVIAGTTESQTLRGQPTEVFEAEGTVAGGGDVVMVDLDDDGDLDAMLATPEGVRWLAR